MSLKEKIVHGALCKCKFGTAPDKLVVLTHKKWYANDPEAKKKLIATNKDIGLPFEKKTFGSCAKMNNNPCVPSITKWDGYYEKEKYDPPGGYVLLEDSKATCAVGGPQCVEILMSGQIAKPSAQNFEDADKELQSNILPLIDMSEFEKLDTYTHLNLK